MPILTKKILENKINDLTAELADKNSLIETMKNDYEVDRSAIKNEYENKTKTKDAENVIKITELEKNNKELESQNKDKQKQLDFQETKKLARAFEDQKIKYEENSRIWAGRLLIAAGALLISTGVSIYLSHGVLWNDKLEYYVVDIIFVSAVWFCVNQYSYYVKQYSDYANRQALAQSYSNIINNTEDESIKGKFLDKATDVLCCKNNVDHKDNLPIEKILSSVLEITKDAVKKIP